MVSEVEPQLPIIAFASHENKTDERAKARSTFFAPAAVLGWRGYRPAFRL
jgi:hypothetical protein